MPHPNGGSAARFHTRHTFAEVRELIGENGITFDSTTHERIKATQGFARDNLTPTIVFTGNTRDMGVAAKHVGDSGSTAINRGSATAPRL